MKRILLVFAFIFVVSMQTGVVAKGQWIYPYSHPTVAAADVDESCEC